MKLKSHGVNGKVYNWIQAWLHERSETTCTCLLEWLSLVMVGCNKWRPTRLGARSDTLPHLHQRHRLRNRQQLMTFADDTKIFGTVDTMRDTERLQGDLDSLLL